VNIPSYRVRTGDVIAVANKSKDLVVIKTALISSEKTEVPGWLEVDIEKLTGKVLSMPEREQIDAPVREQLIVELYSK
jgi:small subunit ribosomal protein S4